MSEANDKSFREYQKEEYGHIAEAHFKTIDSISAFFRYYLLIAAVPLSVAAAMVSDLIPREGGGKAIVEGAGQFIAAKPIALVFGLVGLIGLLMFCYVAQLRFDALLYARQVNLIRKYFYDLAAHDRVNSRHLRLLPIDGNQPHYIELYFLPVALAFGLVNSAYICLGWTLWQFLPTETITADLIAVKTLTHIYVFGGGIALHLVVYCLMGWYRESGYLKRSGILVDIDGVLNKHREHFSQLYNAKFNATLNPNRFDVLPVHRTPGLGVTKQMEREVFRDVTYWTEMPVADGCVEHLRDIRTLGLDIVLVTRRPWPKHGLTFQQSREVLKQWRPIIDQWLRRKTYFLWVREWLRLFFGTMKPIDIVTTGWVRGNGIPCDKLIVEHEQAKFWQLVFPITTRFSVAKRRHLQFCVEDDPINAIKMAYLCEVVFLIDQPYNRTPPFDPAYVGDPGFTDRFPGNVIRVGSWHAIYQHIRRMV